MQTIGNTVTGAFEVTVPDGTVNCTPEVRVKKGNTGVISVCLTGKYIDEYKLVGVVIDKDTDLRGACKKYRLNSEAMLIIDDNLRLAGPTERIKFSILVKGKKANGKTLFMDPHIVNE